MNSCQPEKKDTYKKGLLATNWAQFKNSLAAISTQGLFMQSTLQREACTELPACTTRLPSEPALIKEFLESYFNQ